MSDDPRYQLCKVCGAKDCDCTIMDWVNKPHIENAALRAEVEQLRMALADTEALELGTAERCKRLQESCKMQEQQLAISQLEAKRLRDTMQQIATQEDRSYPEDEKHENGNYFNTCYHCGRTFVGHKRRAVCKVCAAAPQPEPVNNLIRGARLAELVIRMDESRRLKDYQLMHIELNEALEIAKALS